MRFLYVAPRYHTNQIPIMKGLKENGHEVCFISHYRGKIEDYTYVTPVIAGYSGLFRIIDKIYVDLLHRGNEKAGNMKLKCGFPSMRKIRRMVKDFAPDVMIIRERSVYSIFTCLACRGLEVPMILYNQSPLWEKEIKNDLPHRIVRKLLPKQRITPVMGKQTESSVREEGASFVPFVMELKCPPQQKDFFREDRIHILCVGKYEKRKNILMLLKVFSKLQEKYPIVLTVVGECSNDFHREYKQKVTDFLKKNRLTEKVTLLENLTREEMEEQYRGADLFVIPSTEEPASISQLEAMAFSTPVICSDTNGTSCYVKEEVNGYLFSNNSVDSLLEKVEKAVADRARLKAMGEAGYQEIKANCSFELYYEGICKCLEKEKKN